MTTQLYAGLQVTLKLVQGHQTWNELGLEIKIQANHPTTLRKILLKDRLIKNVTCIIAEAALISF